MQRTVTALLFAAGLLCGVGCSTESSSEAIPPETVAPRPNADAPAGGAAAEAPVGSAPVAPAE